MRRAWKPSWKKTMNQYLIAIHHPDDYDPSAETEETIEKIHALNREMIAAGARKFACGISPAGNAKTVRAQPDGKVLVTVAGDGTIRVWDPAAGKSLKALALRTPLGIVSQVAFHPSGDRVATVNGNGTVTVVKLPDLSGGTVAPSAAVGK